MSNLVDIVIPLSTQSRSDNLQLRLALRSIHRYARNLGNIFIYTKAQLPWIQNVTIVPFQDTQKQNKDANLFNKLLAAANNPDIRQNFMFWSDDQVLTDYLDLNQAPIVVNNRSQKHFKGLQKLSKWQQRMIHTFRVVKNIKGCSLNYNFDSHVPQPYKKSLVLQIFPILKYTQKPGLCINTAYFGIQNIDNIVHQHNVKHTLEGAKHPLAIPQSMLLYLGYDQGSWHSGLSMFLLGYFYQLSPYQKSL